MKLSVMGWKEKSFNESRLKKDLMMGRKKKNTLIFGRTASVKRRLKRIDAVHLERQILFPDPSVIRGRGRGGRGMGEVSSMFDPEKQTNLFN